MEDKFLKIWLECIEQTKLECDLDQQKYNLWLRPLQSKIIENKIFIYAPNRFVMEYVKDNYFELLKKKLLNIQEFDFCREVELKIGSFDAIIPDKTKSMIEKNTDTKTTIVKASYSANKTLSNTNKINYNSSINSNYRLSNFIVGDTNKIAYAAVSNVVYRKGKHYNPLLIYGKVGLGKTHLIHAIANETIANDDKAVVLYIHSEKFVTEMIKSLQFGRIEEFKNKYKNIDIILIDDIQFFAGKERSQEEFFYMFNYMIDNKHQIVITSDRYPKEINGIEDRLKSRLVSGLIVAIDPPDLETRVAILISKSIQFGSAIPDDVAIFIAKHVKSNVRELEGVLRRVIATSQFKQEPINLNLVKESLSDLLILKERMVNITNIKAVVAQYFKIGVLDLASKKRIKKIANARHMAMALCRELTDKSFSEIGENFGRDHASVMHAVKKINKTINSQPSASNDYNSLMSILSDW